MAEEIDVRSVGTEFVRLYYTMLNEKPECVHLFFTQNSSYIHGGFEKAGEEMPPVRGQAAIRNMIASFNFNDCRTKVLQIDCQETVKKAVLVQVSGELSNNGEPMRRFMQSFVLAPQGPKKYYVHNNIFRYQDEVFADSENLSFDQCEGFDLKTEDVENGTNGVAEETDLVAPSVVTAEVQAEIQIPELTERTAISTEPSPAASEAVLQMNEVVDDVPQMTAAPVVAVVEEVVVPASPVAMEEEQESKKEMEKETLPQVVPSQKPFSWASLASKNAVAATNVTATAAPKPQAAIKPERKTDAEPAPASAAPLPQRAPRSSRPEMSATESERKWTPGPNDDPVSKRSTYPDNQQLFVGNLPHSVTDKELQEFFEQYGSVADVKINRKGPTTNLPNFGFVAFETTDAVQQAMKAKPLMLYGKHRINIEEKKDHSELGGRSRMNSRGRGGNYGGRGSYVSRGGRGAGHTTARPTSGGSSGPEAQQ